MALLHIARLATPELFAAGGGAIICTGNTSAYRGKAARRRSELVAGQDPAAEIPVAPAGHAQSSRSVFSYDLMQYITIRGLAAQPERRMAFMNRTAYWYVVHSALT